MKKTLFLLIFLCFLLTGFILMLNNLPTDTSSLFSGSGNCAFCHSGSEGVLTNLEGRDISPVYHWQSSMMGNSAIDPYWQAKVGTEVEENPHLQEIIEDKCLTCHAPMGRTEAIHNGQTHFSFNEIKSDPLSLDGVSCTVCHQIDPDNLTEEQSYSGNYLINPSKIIYGPYIEPFTISMVNNTGYTPIYGEHIKESALCATCHTLSTPFVDNEGNIAGYFPEQMPYFEWLNSAYPEKETSCQKCHMPQVNENLRIASRPANLENKRNPLYEHHFVGGNIIIGKLFKNNYNELDINSAPENLDTTIVYTGKNLMENSLDLTATESRTNNHMSVTLSLRNKTGHKLPTGFPSRRIWIHFLATDQEGNTVFESGRYDKEGNIISHSGMEPHYDTITNENNTQIYEAVLGNTQNNVTTILLEAARYLKDNRIPPVGFTNNQPFDSLIAITGNALTDPNFNKNNLGIQGNGEDKITYLFPYTGNHLKYSVEVCYQTIKPDYLAHLEESSVTEADFFTEIYSSANKFEIISTLIAESDLTKVNFSGIPEWKIYPNPSHGIIFLQGLESRSVSYSIYSLKGEFINAGKTEHSSIIVSNLTRGSYILKINSENKEKFFQFVYN